MKAKFAVIAIALTTNYVFAAEPSDAYSKAIDAHLDCIQNYATKYAVTKESARDIADAAVDACRRHISRMTAELVKTDGAFRFPVREALSTVREHEENAQRGAIRLVIETRNR